MSGKQRIDGQPAYILHSHPYSETSLIVDIFSRDHGRLPLLARGARRPRAALRGILHAFQPIELGWFGAGEVRTLAKADWVGGMPLLSGRVLMLGYYLNELLLRLLPREDPHPQLFDHYAATLKGLSQTRAAEEQKIPPLLRCFEKNLLSELGYGLLLNQEAQSGRPLEEEAYYHYRLEQGPVPLSSSPSDPSVSAVHGKTLLDLSRDDYSDPRTLNESKQLMRRLIQHHLAGHPLQSRRIFMELLERS